MTTYTDEVNIYNPEAVGEGITGAGQTATNYITSVTNDGIVVADAGKGASSGAITSGTTGWHLGGALEYIRSGVARFWIGLKDAAHDLTPTVIIGKRYVSGASDNESHMELDYHSMQMIDKEGDTYFYVSDLRDADGYGTVTETYTAAGGRSYVVNFETRSAETTVVTVDGIEVSKQVDGRSVTLSPPAPAVGSVVTITYQTASQYLKAYTIGSRASGSALGAYSFVEGVGNTASGNYSHAEGAATSAVDTYSHAEGSLTTARFAGHAEGSGTEAGVYAHAQNYRTLATGSASHSEGDRTTASGARSHAQNLQTIAASDNQTALGKFNVSDANGDYALIIGNGTADDARSNAATVSWTGDIDAAGDITDGSGNVLSAKLDASTASSTYLPKAGGTISGNLTVNGDIDAPSPTIVTSGVATAESGITITAQKFARFGNVAQLELTIKHSAAWTVGTQYNVATVNADYVPAINAAGVVGTAGTALLGASGSVYARMHSSADTAAGGQVYLRFTYLLA